MLPSLPHVRARGARYDLIWMSAVWMHLDAEERGAAMQTIGALANDTSAMMITLRHGPVPAGRRMFPVSAEETIALAAAEGFFLRGERNAGLAPRSGRDLDGALVRAAVAGYRCRGRRKRCTIISTPSAPGGARG